MQKMRANSRAEPVRMAAMLGAMYASGKPLGVDPFHNHARALSWNAIIARPLRRY
jgi:TPR repeat protein